MKIMLHEQDELEKAAALNKWKDVEEKCFSSTEKSPGSVIFDEN